MANEMPNRYYVADPTMVIFLCMASSTFLVTKALRVYPTNPPLNECDFDMLTCMKCSASKAVETFIVLHLHIVRSTCV